jgi:putative hydrolase
MNSAYDTTTGRGNTAGDPYHVEMSDPFSGGGGFDPRMFSQVPFFRELAKIMTWTGGPVNWDLARQTAESVTSSAAGGGRALPPGDRDDEEFAAAVTAAELWLDAVTELPAVEGPARALSTQEWVRLATSSEGLGLYLEPVARGMGTALTKGMPEELRAMLGNAGAGTAGEDAVAGVLGPMGAMLYGVQAGSVAGHLAGQLLGTYDLGVPTVDPRVVGVVGGNARRFAEEYEFDATEFRYWLALREAAHRRQFAGVPWLRGHLADLIRRFAAEADFDASGLLESFGGMGLDPTALSDPSRLRDALEGPEGFSVEPTSAQLEVLARLRALMSFTEAWVDTVVRAAATGKLPSLPRIEEVVRRGRAEKGAGQRLLQQLVGLDLSPEDRGAARSFCDAVLTARGQAGLDRAWRSADNLPTREELAEPSRWLLRLAADGTFDDLESELGELPPIPDDLGGLDEA